MLVVLVVGGGFLCFIDGVVVEMDIVWNRCMSTDFPGNIIISLGGAHQTLGVSDVESGVHLKPQATQTPESPYSIGSCKQ